MIRNRKKATDNDEDEDDETEDDEDKEELDDTVFPKLSNIFDPHSDRKDEV
jgi:hypothetical protein